VADIFVSYARADKARVAPLVAALEAQGWSVWWDPEITPGQEFDSQIAAALDAAKAVVVVWTPASVDSRWVRGEAREAADRGILAPVRFEAARLPIDARALHTTDLDDWREDVRSRPFEDLRRALTSLIGDQSIRLAEPTAARRSHSICVLPFANMSGDSEQEYFADGISEDIITDLSKVSALSVIARNTAFTFKGRSVEVPQVARQLNVSHVLEGSVRKSGSRVRITAQLIDGKAGDHVWGDRWDRDLDDIFALQDEISQAIVGALRLKLLPDEKKAIEDRGTTNREAHDAYLRGRALAGALTSSYLHQALDLFREALAIDPDFAPVRGSMAWVYLLLMVYAPEERERTLEGIDALAREALERSPDQWGSHLANGMRLTNRGDWLGGVAAFEKALALEPPSETDAAQLVAISLVGVGRIGDAIRVMESARAIDPSSMPASIMLQYAYGATGRSADMRAEYERSLRLPGSREGAEHNLLFCIWEEGDPARTKVQFRRFLDSRILSSPFLDKVYEHFEEPAAALAVLREAFEDPANQDGMRLVMIGWYASQFGDQGLALEAVRRGCLKAGSILTYTIWMGYLGRLRRTPGFKQFVRDLGLYDYWRGSGNWGEFARPVGDDDFEIIA
jgi:adenylate cyclase